MGGGLKGKVIHGAAWAYLERLSVQGMQFVIGMILAAAFYLPYAFFRLRRLR